MKLRLVKDKGLPSLRRFAVKKFAAVVGGMAVIGAASCGRLPANHQAMSRSASLSTSAVGQVVMDSHQGGNRTLQVNLLPPVTPAFAAQTTVHRWVASDVTEYDVTLSAGGQSLLTVQVLPQGRQNSAVLDNLRFGVQYTVSVVAKGNDVGGTADPVQILNSQNPAIATVEFSGVNDVDNEQSIAVQVRLDSVTFDGSATVSLGSTDGAYANPSEPESGYASSGLSPAPAPGSTPEPTPEPSVALTSASTPIPTPVPSPAWTLPPGT